MTGYVADLSWKSGARAIEKLDRLRWTLAVNVLILMPNQLFVTETQNGAKMSERENKSISTYYYIFFVSTLKSFLL